MFDTTAVETEIASDDDVACITGQTHVEDFAAYLRALYLPVEIDGRDSSLQTGFLCEEDIIRHRRERDFARRVVTKADWIKWPNVSTEGSSKLFDICVLVEPPEEDALFSYHRERPSHTQYIRHGANPLARPRAVNFHQSLNQVPFILTVCVHKHEARTHRPSCSALSAYRITVSGAVLHGTLQLILYP
ncbi:hypothetical protein PsYK624_134680 [Phanerochaete sordida]|uniref:Uncharacterized protein n=1 Tax=Phanerochaete sordida TaxID=48140 RepID=A0A9P3GKM8_9APHY|nr:hypothetical protein PsYK624_134680 [Phanerochaete sordida]